VRQLSPKIAGNTTPLPVKGSVAVIAPGRIDVVVVAAVLPCGPTGVVVGGSVAVLGETSIVVVGAAVVVAAEVVVVTGAAVVGGATVVGGTTVVCDATVVDDATVVVVGDAVVVVVGQTADGGSDAEAVESKLRSLLRIVSVTVPLAGAAPVACQICCGPDPFVS